MIFFLSSVARGNCSAATELRELETRALRREKFKTCSGPRAGDLTRSCDSLAQDSRVCILDLGLELKSTSSLAEGKET